MPVVILEAEDFFRFKKALRFCPKSTSFFIRSIELANELSFLRTSFRSLAEEVPSTNVGATLPISMGAILSTSSGVILSTNGGVILSTNIGLASNKFL